MEMMTIHVNENGKVKYMLDPPLATEVSFPEEKLVGNFLERRSRTVSNTHSTMFTGHYQIAQFTLNKKYFAL